MPRSPRDPEEERHSAAELIALLLGDRRRRIAEGRLSGANGRHIKNAITHSLLWRFSEADGDKYDGCRYWTEGALQSRERHGKAVTDERLVGSDALRHEHLFPRKQLIERLFALDVPDVPDETAVADVRALLDRYNIAVIVTLEEDRRLPREGDPDDPWERYRGVGIAWREVHCGPGVTGEG